MANITIQAIALPKVCVIHVSLKDRLLSFCTSQKAASVGVAKAMLAAGVPARLGALTPAPADAPLTVQSTTGMYLCNYMTYRLAKLSRETGLRAGFMHVPTQTVYACRHRERMLAAAADEEAKEKLLAAPRICTEK